MIQTCGYTVELLTHRVWLITQFHATWPNWTLRM